MEIDHDVLKEFKWFIYERESIRDHKDNGDPKPWTDDPILQKYKFTNIWRQDDRVTKIIISRALRESVMNKAPWQDVVLNIFIMRIVNNVDGIKDLPWYNIQEPVRIPQHIKFGDAFIVLPHLPKGIKKYSELGIMADWLRSRLLESPCVPATTKGLHDLIRMKRIEGLILYEITCDFWQLFGRQEDYVNIGGGALPALIWLFPHEHKFGVEHIKMLLDSLDALCHPIYGKMTLRCVEGALCEFRKYKNLKSNPDARKRYYAR